MKSNEGHGEAASSVLHLNAVVQDHAPQSGGMSIDVALQRLEAVVAKSVPNHAKPEDRVCLDPERFRHDLAVITAELDRSDSMQMESSRT